MSQTTPSSGANPPKDQQAAGPANTRPGDVEDRPEPSPRPADRPAPPPGEPPAIPAPPGRPRRSVGLMVALGVALAVIAALVAVILWPNDEEEGPDTEPPTTLAPSTTATPTTEPSTTLATPTTSPATSAVPPPTVPLDTSTAVFPDVLSTVRFSDPVQAARAFAVDFIGFTDPLVGELMQGDARSGEVEVRPMADGPVTTVFLRQLTPGRSWWVLGAATANIATDAPGPGDTITSPVTVSGSALAFEGTVSVEVRQDGTRRPLGTGVVTGGGDILRPFSGQIEFSTPTSDDGAVMFLTRSEQDGQVWEAAVIRVRFL